MYTSTNPKNSLVIPLITGKNSESKTTDQEDSDDSKYYSDDFSLHIDDSTTPYPLDFFKTECVSKNLLKYPPVISTKDKSHVTSPVFFPKKKKKAGKK